MLHKLDYDILLSYSLADSFEADELASALDDSGLRVWFDQWEVIPGQSLEGVWQEALAVAGIICVCVGSSDPLTEHLSGKLLRSKDHSDKLFRVLLPGAQEDHLPPELSQLHAIDLRDGEISQALGRISDAVLSLKGKAAERADTLTAMNNIAVALRSSGDYEKAQTVHAKVLDIRKHVLGEQHPETLASMNNLANTLAADGKLKEAQQLLEGALEASQKTIDKQQEASAFSGLVERGLSFFGKESSAQVAATVKQLAPQLRGSLYGTLSAQGKLIRQDRKKALIQLATEILGGRQAPPRECLNLALELKRERAFGYARQILQRALWSAGSQQPDEDPKLRLKLTQQLALCTFKDPDLVLDLRLDQALVILGRVDNLETTTDPDTLGIAGSINKRKWEVDGQLRHLVRAYHYHRRGYEQGITDDFGYNAINTAFLLDLLAFWDEQEAEHAGGEPYLSEQRRAEGRKIREEIIRELPPLVNKEGYEWLAGEWWFYSTIGEAYFGLQEYEKAIDWLVHCKPTDLNVPEWEYESTARQLAWLARLQGDVEIEDPAFTETQAWGVLQKFLGDDVRAVRSAFLGKIGLALSGGGFRASLFHIGVLARLAELDVLRHVEVLSCVSGGSIVGAHYYLELRRLFQSKVDREITRDDYIDIVQRIQRDFLAGIQRNVRSHVMGSLIMNLRMLYQPNYSRTLRAGQLFERFIFSKVDDGEGKGPRWLNDLFIQPAGEAENFMPQYDNWRRAAKVPVIIINATTLNTGHNWQFTTSWMGESPASIAPEVDSNDRLRRMYYAEAPDAYTRIRLGHAVAASASVPGLFEPLAFPGLYPDRVVQLIDGSFRDGQGTLALLEQDCNFVLASDGTAHVESRRGPTGDFFLTLVRAVGVLVASLREAKFYELKAHRTRLRGLMYVHLKKDLDVETIDWIGSADPHEIADSGRSLGELTSYGIRKSVQKLLAEIRADFDSYTEVEAYALMTSGYRMTEREFSDSIQGFSTDGHRANWEFLKIEPVMNSDTAPAHQELLRLLRVAGELRFKALAVSPFLRVVGIIAAVLAAGGIFAIAWNLFTFGTESLATLMKVFFTIIALFTLEAIFSFVFLGRKPVDYIINVLILIFGFPSALFRIYITDRIYLGYGSFKRLLNHD
jgi:predicted acylesterase/phospholipase RssA/tetratricopeptide (TPR) repeat protein